MGRSEVSEKVVRSWVIKALRPLHAIPVENPIYPGTPDVAHVLGWLELKHVERAPVRASSPVRLPHYTTEQRLWAKMHSRAGGNCHVLLQVEREVFLLDGFVAANILGTATLAEIRAQVFTSWKGRPSPQSLLTAIMQQHLPWDSSFLRQAKNSAFKDADKTGVS